MNFRVNDLIRKWLSERRGLSEARLENVKDLLGQRHVFLGFGSIVELLLGLLLLLLVLLLSTILLLLLLLSTPGLLLLRLLLLLPSVLRSSPERVRSVVVRLSVLLLVVVLRSASIVGGWIRGASSQIDVHTTFVLLSVVLEAELAADVFDCRLDLLDVVDGVITFADNAVELSQLVDVIRKGQKA